MSGPEPSAPVKSVVLALAALTLVATPQWAFVLWMARPSFQRRVAQSAPRRLLAIACGITLLFVTLVGSLWVKDVLVGPVRPELQRIVTIATFAQQALMFLGFLGIVWAAKKHRDSNVAIPPRVRGKPTPRTILVVLLAWVAIAGLLIAMRLGPLAGRPAAVLAERLVVLSLLVIATLIVLLIVLIRGAWRARTTPGNGATGSR